MEVLKSFSYTRLTQVRFFFFSLPGPCQNQGAGGVFSTLLALEEPMDYSICGLFFVILILTLDTGDYIFCIFSKFWQQV